MEKNSTGTPEASLFDGTAWFDPIEMGVRERVRGFIEAMLEEDLTEAQTRLLTSTLKRKVATWDDDFLATIISTEKFHPIPLPTKPSDTHHSRFRSLGQIWTNIIRTSGRAQSLLGAQNHKKCLY